MIIIIKYFASGLNSYYRVWKGIFPHHKQPKTVFIAYLFLLFFNSEVTNIYLS